MKIQLYSQFETEVVTETGEILRLPADYTDFEIDCSIINESDSPDVVAVDKKVEVNGEWYGCRTHVSSLEFLECLAAASPCYSTAVFDATPGPKPADLELLVAGVHIWCDDRETMYFCFQRLVEVKPRLYRLRRKYYSAYVDLFVRRVEHARLAGIYGRFQSKVILEAVDETDELHAEDLLWFAVPEAMLLWSNQLALAEESGRQFWCISRRPILPRFRKVTPPATGG